MTDETISYIFRCDYYVCARNMRSADKTDQITFKKLLLVVGSFGNL
jgi:hypothetical protein